MKITLQIGKGIQNPSDLAYSYMHVRMQALTMRTHSGPCTRMLLGKKTLANFFHYKIVVKGFQTFIKLVLSSGTIL